MSSSVLPFEKPLVEILDRIRSLRASTAEGDPASAELVELEHRAQETAHQIFSKLTAWQKVQLSRHPLRPYTPAYIQELLNDFYELHGDRRFGDDAAIVGGLARFHGKSVMVIGHQKGRGVKENLKRNFGMPHPEGYRKALRLYELADRFSLPILTFIDTPGAYPGIGAEERGQSEAIGSCIAAMAQARVPIIATIVGEGGSGGALALGVANRVLIFEYATYSVITPEGCASILWGDASQADVAAERMKMTAVDLLRLHVVDRVIPEPIGGAHRNLSEAARLLDTALCEELGALQKLSPGELVEQRYQRFRTIGSIQGSP